MLPVAIILTYQNKMPEVNLNRADSHSNSPQLHPSLVPRPLPDFISQLWRKIGEWPGDEANYIPSPLELTL